MKNLIILVILSLYTYTSLSQGVQQAVAVLNDISGNDNPLFGTIRFINNGATTTVRMNISNIGDGEYAVLVHEFGDLRGFVPDANENISEWRALGNVFNPDNSPRGCPGDGTVAFGDLGNWNASSGLNTERTLTRALPLTGTNSLIGRSVAVYDTGIDCNDVANFSGTPIAFGLIGIAFQTAGTRNTASADTANTRGICVLRGTALCNGDDTECDFGQTGVFVFESNGTGVRVFGVVNGLNQERGLHVHEFGDLSDANATSAGEHYNPDGFQHGLPVVNAQRHVGDLGNIQSFADNNAYYDFTPSYTPVPSFSVANLIGRSLIIHTSYDHGNDPTCSDGALTGSSGQRQYACVIGIAHSDDDNGNFFVPNIPSSLTNVNNTFKQVPCGAVIGTTGAANNGTTTTTTTTGSVITGVVGPTSGDNDNDNDWDVPEDASAETVVASFFLLLMITFVVLFV